MKTSLRSLLMLWLALTCAIRAQTPPAAEAPPAPPVADAAPVPDTPPATPAAPAAEATPAEPPLRRLDAPETPDAPAPAKAPAPKRVRARGQSDGPPFGNHTVPAGESRREAVSLFGSTNVDGKVDSDAVSILGDTRIGPDAKVGGAAVAVLGRLDVKGEVGGEAVSVLGGVTIDSRVKGEAVAVLGDLVLGPNADVGGDVVVVGGTLRRDPAAVVRGNVVRVPFPGAWSDAEWLLTWFRKCVLLARPLAFGPHLGWAWLVAGTFLAFYLLLALIFPRALEKCAVTLETRPGFSLLSAVLTTLLTPVALVLLAVTVIGAVLVPFLGVALLCAGLFGKAVMLAWIGRRFTGLIGDSRLATPFFTVLLGGLLVMLLYTVPVFGFLLYKLLGWLGLGVVVYTVALAMKREKPAAPAPAAGASGPAAPVAPVAPVTPPPAAPVAAPAPAAFSAGSPFTVAPESGLPPTSSGFSGFAAGATEASGAAVPPPVAPPVYAVPPVMPPPPAAPAAPVFSAVGLPRASFWIRMGALLIDVVLVGLVAGMLSSWLPRGLQFDVSPPSLFPLLALYGAVLWKLRGTTIGGIICGLKTVRTDGRELDWATAIVRALACILSVVCVGLGFIWIAIDSEKQGWHDKIAGTTVVRVPKGIPLV